MISLTQSQKSIKSNFQPIFVSGSPRSGTTVCHALICTSKDVNDYVPESSYLTGMLDLYRRGSYTTVHNMQLFGSMRNFHVFAIEQILHLLTHLWLRLGKKKYLCLKDPMMVPCFEWLDQVLRHVKYIVTYRDPVETISSRVTVARNQGKNMNAQLLAELTAELQECYKSASNLLGLKRNRTLLINYQEIIDGSADEKLKGFLELDDINRSIIWESEFVSKEKTPYSEFSTPKNFSKITKEKTDIILTATEIEYVNDRLRAAYNHLCNQTNYTKHEG